MDESLIVQRLNPGHGALRALRYVFPECMMLIGWLSGRSFAARASRLLESYVLSQVAITGQFRLYSEASLGSDFQLPLVRDVRDDGLAGLFRNRVKRFL